MSDLIIKKAKLKHYELGYVEYGEENSQGLIIMPAIISRIRNWNFIAEFMGQKFHSVLFDLPGHGESKLISAYNRELFGKSMIEFADYLGFERVSLMGFSFGGMLVMTSLKYLKDRVDNVILLAPVLDKDVISIEKTKRKLAVEIIRFLGYKPTMTLVSSFVSSKIGSKVLSKLVAKFIKLDHPEMFRKSLRNIEKSALESLAVQCKEVMALEEFRDVKYQHRCFYAVSKQDPMIDPEKSKKLAESIFENIYIDYLDMPYHQPKEPYTLEFANEKFGHLLDLV
ncbi:alpha/beta hydrolase [Candidatus Dojkabacteria bacterium]|nr:alpha/beta hydrolase [Candidatus Dojkabacteria bacterium]